MQMHKLHRSAFSVDLYSQRKCISDLNIVYNEHGNMSMSNQPYQQFDIRRGGIKICLHSGILFFMLHTLAKYCREYNSFVNLTGFVIPKTN